MYAEESIVLHLHRRSGNHPLSQRQTARQVWRSRGRRANCNPSHACMARGVLKRARHSRRIVTASQPIPKHLIERVEAGLPIVYPTSTQPALGCLPNAAALDRLFEVKGRPEDLIVSLGVANLDQARALVEVPERAEEILAAFPPGSLTLVLPAHHALDARLGGERVAIRLLSHPRARELVALTGPLTATSANPSGHPPHSECTAAAAALGLDEGSALEGMCVGGTPSTLIAWNVSGYASIDMNWTIIREGKVSAEEIKAWSTQPT